jgi:hypothetical protein
MVSGYSSLCLSGPGFKLGQEAVPTYSFHGGLHSTQVKTAGLNIIFVRCPVRIFVRLSATITTGFLTAANAGIVQWNKFPPHMWRLLVLGKVRIRLLAITYPD